MSAAIPANVTPAVLAWARAESGYTVERVAKRLAVRPARVTLWELGERKPTVRQVQALARFFHRPFGLFFLPAPPKVMPLAAEYRRLSGVDPEAESPEFRLAIRVMQQRRLTSIELSDELGQTWPDFGVASRVDDGPAAVGRRLRDRLGVTDGKQGTWRDEWQAWKAWRAAAEDAGVLVFQFPKVPLAEARGISLFDFPLPVVGINSREPSAAARAFSLLHELVHVSLALGQDERPALSEKRSTSEWAKLERFAEEAASEALIPGDVLSEKLSRTAGRTNWDIQAVRSLASAFKVTPMAMATRLRSAGAMTWATYAAWRESWNDHLATLKPKTGGMSTPIDKTLGRAGRPFTQLVLEALDANRITAVDASRYLDLRFDHIGDLRQELAAGPAVVTSGE